ncbi:MAG: SRPBCC domain-containing protein [Myxococcales bacterium]|nr:SRPBCC domain-containing protein [Myxococcales bacterium]
MPEVVTSIEIDATAFEVAQVLHDFSAYDAWNPLIHHLRGEPRIGGRIRFRLRLGALALPIDAILIRHDETGLAWQGPASRGLRALAAGEHYFELAPRGGGRVRLVHGERFTGPISRLLWPHLAKELHSAYGEMNLALKRRVEGMR